MSDYEGYGYVRELEARVADLERTAQAAEDMRDASDARVAELEAALVQFRYEDCPDTLCLARAEMIADVTPISPGSKNTIVKPTGMRIEHTAACPIGRAMSSVSDEQQDPGQRAPPSDDTEPTPWMRYHGVTDPRTPGEQPGVPSGSATICTCCNRRSIRWASKFGLVLCPTCWPFYRDAKFTDDVKCTHDGVLRPNEAPCVTPNGRTDGHGSYVDRDSYGALVCAFCKRSLDAPRLDNPKGLAEAKSILIAKIYACDQTYDPMRKLGLNEALRLVNDLIAKERGSDSAKAAGGDERGQRTDYPRCDPECSYCSEWRDEQRSDSAKTAGGYDAAK